MIRWFASTNRENWEIIQKKNIWGIPKRNKAIIERVKPGDSLIIFVSQKKIEDKILPSAITGIYEICSDGYEDVNPIFKTPEKMGMEIFPYRVKLKPIQIFSRPLEFKPLIPKLNFIKNKNQWSGHLRVAMRPIPEEDYQTILKAAKQ